MLTPSAGLFERPMTTLLPGRENCAASALATNRGSLPCATSTSPRCRPFAPDACTREPGCGGAAACGLASASCGLGNVGGVFARDGELGDTPLSLRSWVLALEANRPR